MFILLLLLTPTFKVNKKMDFLKSLYFYNFNIIQYYIIISTLMTKICSEGNYFSLIDSTYILYYLFNNIYYFNSSKSFFNIT